MVSTAIRENSWGTQLYDIYFLYEGFKQIHRPFQFSLLIRMKLSTSANPVQLFPTLVLYCIQGGGGMDYFVQFSRHLN